MTKINPKLINRFKITEQLFLKGIIDLITMSKIFSNLFKEMGYSNSKKHADKFCHWLSCDN